MNQQALEKPTNKLTKKNEKGTMKSICKFEPILEGPNRQDSVNKKF
jgi:hypothetical protein